MLLVEQNARAGLAIAHHGAVLDDGRVALTGAGPAAARGPARRRALPRRRRRSLTVSAAPAADRLRHGRDRLRRTTRATQASTSTAPAPIDPGQRLVQHDRAERDRHDRVHVRVRRDRAERRVVEQPDVRGVADDASRTSRGRSSRRSSAPENCEKCGFVVSEPDRQQDQRRRRASRTTVAANESRGIGSRVDRNEPIAHITAEATTSRSDQSGAPPLGRTSSASPPKPTTHADERRRAAAGRPSSCGAARSRAARSR